MTEDPVMSGPAESTAHNLGEQARSTIADAGATAQALARRGREQAAMASDVLYQQGARAGEYLTRNVSQYPLSALLLAGAIGLGLGYLAHARWPTVGRRRGVDGSVAKPAFF
jgi:ElaB/YqjD/DUF883 family membrane-anchored ribosome-binding protein